MKLNLLEPNALLRLQQDYLNSFALISKKSFTIFEKNLDKLCSIYILEYFRFCKIDLDTQYSSTELKEALNINSKFEKFFDYMLRLLLEDQLIELHNGQIKFLKSIENLPSGLDFYEKLINEFSEFEGIIKLLYHCTKHYPYALSGVIPAINVLYPDGTPIMLNEALGGKFSQVYGIQINKECLVNLLTNLPRQVPTKILEIGAGSGDLTWEILPKLKNNCIEYYFTDISRAFLFDAKKKAKQYAIDFIKFSIFDISKEPGCQGLHPGDFDIILGLNVVHAASDIIQALNHLKSLIKPQGVLILIETTHAARWAHMVWGLTEGWWHFNDNIRHYVPLLAANTWINILTNLGYTKVITFPHDEKQRKNLNTSLIIAQC